MTTTANVTENFHGVPTHHVLVDAAHVGTVQHRDDAVNGPRWVAFAADGAHLATVATLDAAVAATC